MIYNSFQFISIEQVAWVLGYEDPAFFRRLFKRNVGITPGAYRRKFRIPKVRRSKGTM